MLQLTAEGRRVVEEVASRHRVSADAALTLLTALAAGHGTQAQFSHPELGGMGQWSRGGMIMVGDMFDNALKARVDALCTELSGLLDRPESVAVPTQSQSQSQGGAGVGVSLFVPGRSASWWPADLGTPAAVGAQNDLRYAYFPAARRLAIDLGGRLSLHDTGEHRISGVSQQQGSDQSVTFTSQLGIVRLADLPRVSAGEDAPADPGPERTAEARRPDEPEAPASRPAPAPQAPHRAAADDDIFAKIERLAALRRKDILTEEEYAAKKSELLARL
jgi:hypothetical protein